MSDVFERDSMRVEVFARGGVRVVGVETLEGRRFGARAVVVGSAITRPDHVTRWFAEALAGKR